MRSPSTSHAGVPKSYAGCVHDPLALEDPALFTIRAGEKWLRAPMKSGCALRSMGVLLFAHDAFRHVARELPRQVLLARLKELRRRHRGIRELRLFATPMPE